MLKPISFRISYFATRRLSSEEVAASIWVEAALSIHMYPTLIGPVQNLDQLTVIKAYTSLDILPHTTDVAFCVA